jgi:UDP-N-acetylglucosamine 2-epimerase
LKVTLVLGTRPQIIKSSLFISLASKDREIRLEIIHTGQHYDYEMTRIFFEELDLPDPDLNLDVGSGSHAQQTANIMLRLEENWKKNRPELVLVPGDTNSTLAGALTAAKLTIPVAHMEAGARSYDLNMPEEINRRLTDHCSTQFFTATRNCTRNLLREGIEKKSINETGDTMYDVLLQQLPKAEKSTILKELSLKKKTYALWTTHRPENVDDYTKLRNIVEAMVRLAPLTIVFPVHPRTEKQLEAFDLLSRVAKQEHVRMIKPQGYDETLNLIQNASVVTTDSGGMQKEAFWLKIPCVTIRKCTEWTETTEMGANRLAEANAEKIAKAVERMITCGGQIRRTLSRRRNPFGDGQASQKILAALKSCYA